MMKPLLASAVAPISIARALSALSRVPTHVLLIAPTTRRTLAFAQALVRRRACIVTRGPLTEELTWPREDCLRTGAEIAHAFSGQPELPQTLVSFPDQVPCVTSTSVMVPFLGATHVFSTLDALIVLRHRPRVFALSTSAKRIGLKLVELQYASAFDAEGRLVCLGDLARLLLEVLESDLAVPPADWLARTHLDAKSERHLWMQAREELKDIECLLRMQLQSRFCDRERISAALAAVIERQKVLIGTSLP